MKTNAFVWKQLLSYIENNGSLMSAIAFLRKTNVNNAFPKNTMVLEGEERKHIHTMVLEVDGSKTL